MKATDAKLDATKNVKTAFLITTLSIVGVTQKNAQLQLVIKEMILIFFTKID